MAKSAAPTKRAGNARRAAARRESALAREANRDTAAAPDTDSSVPDSTGDATSSATKTSTAIPQLAVWERRLVNPATQGSRAVLLKTGGFELRWINTGVEGRYQEAIHEEGWIPVDKSELADPNQITGLFKNPDDTYVRTGPEGVYLLCKMPKRVYDAIARRKVEIGQSKRRSAKQQRERIMERAAAHSPGGAEAVGRLKGEITELIERVEMAEEDVTPNLPAADAGASDAIRRSELL
jgi:hypothetical protein